MFPFIKIKAKFMSPVQSFDAFIQNIPFGFSSVSILSTICLFFILSPCIKKGQCLIGDIYRPNPP